MMEKREILKRQLEQLSSKLRIVFAADCANWALRQYERWSENEGKGWGDPGRLKQALSLIWQSVESENVASARLEQEYHLVHDLVPDSEKFPQSTGNGALDAGLAVLEALDCAKSDGKIENAISASEAARFAVDTVSARTTAEFRNMSQTQLQRYIEEDSQAVIDEWNRQLAVLKQLMEWREVSITRAQFTRLLKS